MAKRKTKEKYEPTPAEQTRSDEVSSMVYACISSEQIHELKAKLLDELKASRYLRVCWGDSVRTTLNDIYILEEDKLCDIDTK